MQIVSDPLDMPCLALPLRRCAFHGTTQWKKAMIEYSSRIVP